MAKKFYDSMISENRSAMANLPQEVIIKKYPEVTGYTNENLNDGLSGVDYQMKKDTAKRGAKSQPEKY